MSAYQLKLLDRRRYMAEITGPNGGFDAIRIPLNEDVATADVLRAFLQDLAREDANALQEPEPRSYLSVQGTEKKEDAK